jgi:acetyl esterase/lipase
VYISACVSVWQGLQLAEKMRKDGVLVDVDEAEDMVHAFQHLAPFHSACTAGILRLATFARRMAPGSPSFPSPLPSPACFSPLYVSD